MPQWLYDLPAWLFGPAIVLGWVAFGLAGRAAWQRLARRPLADADRRVAAGVLAAAATANSLLLAFSAAVAWDARERAAQAAGGEAATLAELDHQLAVFGGPDSRAARERLKAYGRSVVAREWPAMQTRQADGPTRDAFDALYRAIGDLHPATPHDSQLMPGIWARTDELVRTRSARLDAVEGRVPDALWAVMLLGTALALAPAFVLPRGRIGGAAAGVLSLSMGLLVFFIAAMDRPFAGPSGLGPDAMAGALSGLQHWDAQTAAYADSRGTP